MDNITYELILEYLTKKTSQETDFPNKHNLMVKMTECDCFSKYFNNNYFRYGILSYATVQNNISFYSTFLNLVDNNFISLNKYKQNKIVYLFKDYILNQLKEENLYKKKKF